MHERLFEALLAVAGVHGANLRLVASYADSSLGFPSGKQLQVFIPDLHLLSAARGSLYRYGVNHEAMLADAVAALLDLRRNAADDESVVVFHIGDYLDLWRESLTPGADADVPRRIKNDHQALAEILEHPDLNTHFLLGNHDFDLYELATYNAWERRFFLPGDSPSILVLHGDYFDWIERHVPAELRDIAVYLFGKSHQAGSAILAKMAGLTHRQNASRDFSQRLQLTAPAPLGSLQSGDAHLGESYNVQTAGDTVDGGLLFLDQACGECVNANAQFGTNIHTVIIGHTHHARIASKKMPDGSPFTLIDTGAWIEDCKNADGSLAFPNAQITAISANEARIYQLDREN